MNKAVLLVSFGTINSQVRKRCIYSIEEKIRKLYSDYMVLTAFIGRFIIDRVREMGETALSIEDAFEIMENENIKEAIVQPVLIADAEESQRVVNIVNAYSGDIKIKTGRPLLYYDFDYDKMADLLIGESQKDKINIFMGHGNKNYDGSTYLRLQDKIIQKGVSNVFIATVEGEPSFEGVLEKTAAGSEVFLQPMMIVAGDHAVNDMSGDDEDSWKSRLLNHGCSVEVRLKGLGEIQGLTDLISEHIVRAL